VLAPWLPNKMRWVLIPCLLASPAVAQDGPATFSLPVGCTAYLTVQNKNCAVDHHFTCEGDPAGHKQRASLDEQGMTYLGTIDDETQWIGSYRPVANYSERLEQSPVDPASLTELIATGRDTFDFMTLSDEIGTTRYVGSDELTGRAITIDGVTLDETKYSITVFGADGAFLWSSTGNEFISRDWRMFLGGTAVTTTPTDEYERDASPVEFIFPGEDGFLSTKPKFGCGVVMSSTPALSLQENNHDAL